MTTVLSWLDSIEYPDPTTAVVGIEAHHDHGVTVYRVTLDYDRANKAWLACSVDPDPPTDALARMLADEAVERLTEKEDREYAEAAWEARAGL